MPHQHVFENICLDFEAILSSPDFKRMLKVVQQQAKLPEAKKRTDIGNYKDYNVDEWSPMYFGMFVEWFAEQYLNYFGYLYNIANVEMFDAVGTAYQDNGVDGQGITMTTKKPSVRSSIIAKQGGPIYIQVKGTLNFNKEHMANDGSRLPNFTTNAMSTAIKNGHAYSARYVLFTTARGIHYRLKEMWNDMVEIIDIHKITQLTENNQLFLNVLREKVGLEPFPFQAPPIDCEAQYNLLQITEE